MEIVKKVKLNGLDFTIKVHGFLHGSSETYRFAITLLDNIIYKDECYSKKDIDVILTTMGNVIKMYGTIDSFEIIEKLFNFMEPGGDIRSDLLSNEHLIKCRINQREKDEEFRSAMQILMYNADVEFSKKPFYSSYGIEKDFHSITNYFNQEAKNFPDKEKMERAAAPKGAWTSDKMWQAWSDLHRTLDIKMPFEYKSMLSKPKFPKTFRTMDLKTIEAIINNDAVYLSLSQNDREFLTLFRKIAIENELVKPKEEKKGMGGLFQQLSETYINGLADKPTLFVEDKECADMTIGLYPNEEFKITLNNGREFKVKLAGKEANIKVEQIEDDGSDFDIDKRFHRSRKSAGSPLQMTSRILRPFIKDFENIVSGIKEKVSPLESLFKNISDAYHKADDNRKSFIFDEIKSLLMALTTIDGLEYHAKIQKEMKPEEYNKLTKEHPVTVNECAPLLTTKGDNIFIINDLFSKLRWLRKTMPDVYYTKVSDFFEDRYVKYPDNTIAMLRGFFQKNVAVLIPMGITDVLSLINYVCDNPFPAGKNHYQHKPRNYNPATTKDEDITDTNDEQERNTNTQL